MLKEWKSGFCSGLGDMIPSHLRAQFRTRITTCHDVRVEAGSFFITRITMSLRCVRAHHGGAVPRPGTRGQDHTECVPVMVCSGAGACCIRQRRPTLPTLRCRGNTETMPMQAPEREAREGRGVPPDSRRLVLGSWVGAGRHFHLSLFPSASRMVLPQDPSTNAHPP